MMELMDLLIMDLLHNQVISGLLVEEAVEDKVILEYLLEEEVDLVVVVKVVVDLVPHLLEQLHLLQTMGHPDNLTPVVEVEVLETPELLDLVVPA